MSAPHRGCALQLQAAPAGLLRWPAGAQQAGAQVGADRRHAKVRPHKLLRNDIMWLCHHDAALAWVHKHHYLPHGMPAMESPCTGDECFGMLCTPQAAEALRAYLIRQAPGTPHNRSCRPPPDLQKKHHMLDSTVRKDQSPLGGCAFCSGGVRGKQGIDGAARRSTWRCVGVNIVWTCAQA